MAPLPPSIPTGKPKTSQNLVGRIVLIGAAIFVAFLAFRIFQAVQHSRNNPKTATPGSRAMIDAAKLTVGKSRGVAHGNTPEAEALAEKLSQTLGGLRKTLFEGGDETRAVLTGGEFIVYCRMNADSCAFIIHVPELRHYTGKAQKAVSQLAYVTACSLLDTRESASSCRLAVATRGAVLFDKVLIGDYTPKHPEPLANVTEAPHEGATSRALYSFFLASSEEAASQ